MVEKPTARAVALRDLVKNNEVAVLQLLARYGAANPRLFGSVARGDATPDSDIDLMVDMTADGKDALWELAGLSEDLRQLLGVRVDVVCEKLLRTGVAEAAGKFSPMPRSAHPEIPWSKVIGLRTILIHQYFAADRQLVHAVVEESLPDLIRAVTDMLG